MNRHIRSGVAVLVGLVLPWGAGFAQPLAYRFPAGERFSLVIKTHVGPPTVGKTDQNVVSKVEIASSDSYGMRARQEVQADATGLPSCSFNMGCRIAPEGQVSEVTGVDWNDELKATIARNLANGLPPLPNKVVKIGSTWQGQRPIFIPKGQIPGDRQVVRIMLTSKVTARGDIDGRPNVKVSLNVVQAPGEKTKVEAHGSLLYELATGKPLDGSVSGLATIHSSGSTLKIPIQMTLSTRAASVVN